MCVYMIDLGLKKLFKILQEFEKIKMNANLILEWHRLFMC